MKILKAIVAHRPGIHLTGAGMIQQAMESFQADVRIANGESGRRRTARSMLDITSEVTLYGTQVIIEAEGPDEDAAAEEIRRLIETDLGGA